jgi:hypothetical protein
LLRDGHASSDRATSFLKNLIVRASIAMDVPERWRDYHCEDYFETPLAQNGYWSEPGQWWIIEPTERVKEDCESGFLQIGSPGVDSIGFGYRKGHYGLWAFHRMEMRFQYLASTVFSLLDGWISGHIKI